MTRQDRVPAAGHGTPRDGEPQAEVIAFLAAPASYPDRVERVDRIDTHGAHVFMAGEHVYKIKRAVAFDYMDFSTLAKRRAAVAHEVDVNRAYAPSLYLGVVPIVRRGDGRLAIGGDGEAIEYAVHMRRFPQDALLSAVVARKALRASDVDALADVVVESHRIAPVAGTEVALQRIAATVTEVVRQLGQQTDVLDPDRVSEFADAAARALARAGLVLTARGRDGYVRRCHGDLHCANIVLIAGRPTLFDALDFDEDLATVDTLYDLAFLLMDLMQRDARAEACRLLSRYLWRTRVQADLDGLAALPVFLGLRAAVRALTGAQRAAQVADGSAAASARADAQGYLAAALAHLAPSPRRLVAIGGASGTGKSTLAAALAAWLSPCPGAVHLRTDLERKAHVGVGETERLPPESYTPEAAAEVHRLVRARARAILAAGHSVVVDATFLGEAERVTLAAAARTLSVPFDGLWLTAPVETLLARVEARRGDASDATADVVRRQMQRVAEPPGWHVIDAGSGPEATLAHVRRALRLEHP